MAVGRIELGSGGGELSVGCGATALHTPHTTPPGTETDRQPDSQNSSAKKKKNKPACRAVTAVHLQQGIHPLSAAAATCVHAFLALLF